MCVDFVEAKTSTRCLVWLAEEMDVFRGKYLESQRSCGQKSSRIEFRIDRSSFSKTSSREF
jgi:hypothetical protein